MSNDSTDTAISMPKGGGAVRGIGETFQPNLFAGTGNFSVPLATSPGRGGFGPKLALEYSSGHGNGPFGLGWSLSVPRISRKTEKGLPRYGHDDVFVLSGAEDLVLAERQPSEPEIAGYEVTRYRPRTEGLYARIERWESKSARPHTLWRVISSDNVTSVYGRTAAARLAHPEDPVRIYEWLLQETFDGKGNHVLYEYAGDDEELFLNDPAEQNRVYRQRYLRRIYYGNLPTDKVGEPLRYDNGEAIGHARLGLNHAPNSADPLRVMTRHYAFEVLFDYGDVAAPAQAGDAFAHPPPADEATGERFGVIAGNVGDEYAALTGQASASASAVPVRRDRFSTCRPGFEIRTLRRCRRVLMVHHFRELGGPTLVRSTDLSYRADIGSELSLLAAVTVSGYRRDEDGIYRAPAQMPPVEFEYSAFRPQAQRYEAVQVRGDDAPPRALNDPSTALIDMFGNGLPDVVTGDETGFRYWRNLGGGRLDRPQSLAESPGGFTLGQPGVSFGDLGGDGLTDLIVRTDNVSGLFELDTQSGWQRKGFVQDEALPTELGQPNARLVDLTGDGLSDLLVTDERYFVWYRGRGEEGFSQPMFVPRRPDLDRFPDVYFDDASGRVRLADMSGDGLNDIVLLHNGHIDYWPNRGYGEWGSRITTTKAPRLPEDYDPARLFLVDLDGSGTSDLVYVHFDRVDFWLNRSGNGWSERQTVRGTPITVDPSALRFADFYGKGTACLVWSYDYGSVRGGNYKVLDFSGGDKPYLLAAMDNNLGATTRVQYLPSTHFYEQDRRKGLNWPTPLPFPVQVVAKTEVIDHIGKTKLVSCFQYHHGYYDGREREFRGFGRVDQIDTEVFEEFSATGLHGADATFSNVDEALHVPPVETRSWFHTGAYFGEEALLARYRQEYWQGDAEALAPPSIDAGENAHAHRALRGALLRTEVFGPETAEPGRVPFTVTEQGYRVRQLQAPSSGNVHGVYALIPVEKISYHYEGNASEPRVSQEMTLEVDNYGNTLKNAFIGYGRRRPNPDLPLPVDRDRQTETLITYTENRMTHEISLPHAYRTPLPCEMHKYELTGFSPRGTAGGKYQSEDFVASDPEEPSRLVLRFDGELGYQGQPTRGRQRRLIEQSRTLYRPDDLGESQGDALALLPLGEAGTLALSGESYQLGITSEILSQVFQRPLADGSVEQLYAHPDNGQDSSTGYRDLDGDARGWAPSGREFYSANASDDPVQELAKARRCFFLPQRTRDPFGGESTRTYDNYALLTEEARDPLNNHMTAVNDYRVLQPWQVTDPNRNRKQVAFDTLGYVVGTAVMGKPDEQLGDSLKGFEADLSDTIIQKQLSAPLRNPHSVLGAATTRLIYDLHAYHRTRETQNPEPAVVYSLARETHAADLANDEKTRIQHAFAYFDGFGREIQKKARAEPGPVPQRAADGSIVVNEYGQPLLSRHSVDLRWITSGWTIFNNKGKPVRQYEPFFTDHHRHEFALRIGVGPVLIYDPLERLVATLHPDHSWEKVVFDPWMQVTHDQNDTVLLDPRNDGDIGHLMNGLPEADLLPTWYDLRTDSAYEALFAARYPDSRNRDAERRAARLAAAHADTPTTIHIDSLGRPFLTATHNKVACAGHEFDGTEQISYSRVELDIQGNTLAVRDAVVENDDRAGRIIMSYQYDLLGNRIHQLSMEAGERWMLNDVAGNPIRSWDSRGHNFVTTYDELRRPVEQYVRGTTTDSDLRSANREILVDRIEYGEGHAYAEKLNLRTRIYRHFDSAGVTTNARLDADGTPTVAYDFKGNLLRSTRQLTSDYTAIPNWLQNTQLDGETFSSSTRYDALNRPIQSVAPHSSLARAKFNVIQPVFNEANLLEGLNVWLERAAEPAALLDPNNEEPAPVGVAGIDYDAKGQQHSIQYVNGVKTDYRYDPYTFRLAQMRSRRLASNFSGDCPDPPQNGWPGCHLQNLHYSYDPVGNITDIRDDAQQAIFFRNRRVEPSAQYTYDALYRLIESTGREHLGQKGGAPIPHSYNDSLRAGIDWSANDGKVMGTYIERYVYDAVGNFLKMQHRGSDPANRGWTRGFSYNEASLIEDGTNGTLLKTSNRLSGTTVGNGRPITERYAYDAHGNTIRMPHLGGTHPDPNMCWDYRDQLCKIDLGGGGTAYYVYDARGQRVRKVWEKSSSIVEDRLYLGGFEIYRRRHGAEQLERETLHIMVDKQRIAMVETRTVDVTGRDRSPARLIRYQVGNNPGSASVELDEQARIISYEEYAPYGSSTYQAVRSQTETGKQYGYSGKERDEESGLYYYGARYYAPWLGRWTSCDPTGLADGLNLFWFNHCSPIMRTDPTGTKAERHDESAARPNSKNSDTGDPPEVSAETVRMLNLFDMLEIGFDIGTDGNFTGRLGSRGLTGKLDVSGDKARFSVEGSLKNFLKKTKGPNGAGSKRISNALNKWLASLGVEPDASVELGMTVEHGQNNKVLKDSRYEFSVTFHAALGVEGKWGVGMDAEQSGTTDASVSAGARARGLGDIRFTVDEKMNIHVGTRTAIDARVAMSTKIAGFESSNRATAKFSVEDQTWSNPMKIGNLLELGKELGGTLSDIGRTHIAAANAVDRILTRVENNWNSAKEDWNSSWKELSTSIDEMSRGKWLPGYGSVW